MAFLIRKTRQLWKPPLGTKLNPSHPLSRGLVGAWLMNEGGGTSIDDISGNGNNGTGNSISWPLTKPKFGLYTSYNGSSAYINVPNATTLKPTTGISVSAWVNLITFVPSERIVTTRPAPSGTNGYILAMDSTTGNTPRFLIGHSGAYATALSSKTISLNTWHHIAGTWNGATIRIYLDGVQTGSAAQSAITQDTTPIGIGGSASGGANDPFLSGRIDNVLIHNRALSAAEVLQLYAQPFCFMQPRQLRLPFLSGGVTQPTYGFAGAGGIQGTGQIGIAS